MSEELIKRLRDRVVYDQLHYAPDPLLKEAADRIEALNAEVARLREALHSIIRLDHHNHAAPSASAMLARAALGDEA